MSFFSFLALSAIMFVSVGILALFITVLLFLADCGDAAIISVIITTVFLVTGLGLNAVANTVSVRETGYIIADAVTVEKIEKGIEGGNDVYFLSIKNTNMCFDVNTGIIYTNREHQAVLNAAGEPRNIYTENGVTENEKINFCLKQAEIKKEKTK